jgi:hypothetical protein
MQADHLGNFPNHTTVHIHLYHANGNLGLKSIILMPLLIKAPAVSIATPCGVAKKITSHSFKTASSGAVKAKSVCPAKRRKKTHQPIALLL